MTEKSCKICGCTENHACVTEKGPCSWILPNLCSACAVELSPEENAQGNYGLLIEKQCQTCAHLVESKDLPQGYENYWECDAGRINDRMPSGEYIPHCYKHSGFVRPNKTVAAAQRKCPFFAVHPRWKKHEN